MLINGSVSGHRSPRLRAILNGSITVSPVSARVTHNSSFSASAYSLTTPLNDATGLNANYWAALGQAHVKLQVSLGVAEPFVDLVDGYCDTVQVQPITGVAILEGRDLSASLLDTKTFADFQNQTLSDIVKRLAKDHNLTPVLADSSGFSGRTYANQTNLISLSQFSRLTSDWDILVTLAQAGGLDLFVSGSSLHMSPQAPPDLSKRVIQYSDLTDIQVNRTLPLYKGINLTVMSWNSSEQTAVTEASHKMTLPDPSSADPSVARQYTVIQPNLRPSDARTLAAQVAESISAETMSVQLSMPGDVSLTARDYVALRGSGTVFDQTYKTKSLTRIFTARFGYSQIIRATSVA